MLHIHNIDDLKTSTYPGQFTLKKYLFYKRKFKAQVTKLSLIGINLFCSCSFC